MDKKKKPNNYIIPATFFQALSPAKKQATEDENLPKKKEETLRSKQIATKHPVLKTTDKRRSSLSLKSVHQKKIENKSVVEENYENHPKTTFTTSDLISCWEQYTSLLLKKGEKSMASIIGSDKPKLEDNFIISYAVPNKQMKDQFAKNQPKLLGFLRKNLNNYGIEIQLKLNETIEKKFAYTPQEKYNKLKEKNPLLDKLRQAFELDL